VASFWDAAPRFDRYHARQWRLPVTHLQVPHHLVQLFTRARVIGKEFVLATALRSQPAELELQLRNRAGVVRVFEQRADRCP